MKIAINLTDDEGGSLRRRAIELGITPEDLARLAVTELLSVQEPEFLRVSTRVLKKNEGLYRRLR